MGAILMNIVKTLKTDDIASTSVSTLNSPQALVAFPTLKYVPPIITIPPTLLANSG
jgi:hypothetical protein